MRFGKPTPRDQEGHAIPLPPAQITKSEAERLYEEAKLDSELIEYKGGVNFVSVWQKMRENLRSPEATSRKQLIGELFSVARRIQPLRQRIVQLWAIQYGQHLLDEAARNRAEEIMRRDILSQNDAANIVFSWMLISRIELATRQNLTVEERRHVEYWDQFFLVSGRDTVPRPQSTEN